MNEQLKLPIGIESFFKIRTSGFYYVDKTRLIEHLLEHPSEVSLFTRPRRFGKSPPDCHRKRTVSGICKCNKWHFFHVK